MIEKTLFGKVGGQDIFLFRISGRSGYSFTAMNYGATLTEILCPDREGKPVCVICGYEKLEDYQKASGYQGATIGRFANRIGKAEFDLNQKHYALFRNDGNNHLHGGAKGFDKQVWSWVLSDGDEPYVEFSRVSPDGEEGYPGELELTVRMTLKADRILSISYLAVSDKDTPFNFTNHAYFNLNGPGSGPITSHELSLDADRYLPVNSELIPTGGIAPVSGTPFDFRMAKTIGQDIDLTGTGYDHCMVFEDRGPGVFRRATLYSPQSGIGLHLSTDLPSVQLYSGNMMDDPTPFRGGVPQIPREAVCLETELMPDSMHHEGFTDCILKAGCTFSSTTQYEFFVRK